MPKGYVSENNCDIEDRPCRKWTQVYEFKMCVNTGLEFEFYKDFPKSLRVSIFIREGRDREKECN